MVDSVHYEEPTMTNMTPLLERNEQFARTYASVPLGLPSAQVVVVTCLDHRIDPARVLGLDPGAAPGSSRACRVFVPC